MMTTSRRLAPLDIFLLSVWCGLAGGWLEVGVRVVQKILPDYRAYSLSRHFVWMAPLSNLALFAVLGMFLAMATRLWPRRGAWILARFVCAVSILAILFTMSKNIYWWAWAVLALGLAARLLPVVENSRDHARRWFLFSLPVLFGCVLVAASISLGRDWFLERREASRPLPAGHPPNVLLIVMDTVRADHLSAYGYSRPTSPTLEKLAKRGVRFAEARATAPWTLPSHASMFTGRWPHELGVNWRTALGSEVPTLAGYLGSQGYATAGFAANLGYCSYEFGLNRGFTHYEDYAIESWSPLRMCSAGDFTLEAVSNLGWRLSSVLGGASILPPKESGVWRALANDAKIDAATINQNFLHWISTRRQPTRPFFAFLNYLDAHSPYLLPPGTPYQFGRPPRTDADLQVLVDWFFLDKLKLAPPYQALARDCYDSCIRYIDDQMAQLMSELTRRGVLENTIVVITSDHGEGFGEHDLFFHGESLYSTETRVPLVIGWPGRIQASVVSEPISLRDLPATIVDLTLLKTGAPFPGRSLAELWSESRRTGPPLSRDRPLSELASPNPYDPNQGRSPIHRGPLASLVQGDYLYIRNERDGVEELFNRRNDPNEFDDRADFPATKAVKETLRALLDRLRRGKINTN